MSNFGSDYANAYDAMYADKDYVYECEQLEWAFNRFGKVPIKSVLDIGCGTGRHCWELARRGFTVTGIDRSLDMLNIANSRIRTSSSDNQPLFKYGDAIDFEFNYCFDAVVMMFAVLSYLNTNDSLIAGLTNVSKHLKPGGLFLADFWYGPGVLMDNPEERSHERFIGETKVQRKVTPQLNLSQNSCSLFYQVKSVDINGQTREISEVHNMRYLFGPELEMVLSIAGMELLHLGQSPNWAHELQDADWTGSLIARRL